MTDFLGLKIDPTPREVANVVNRMLTGGLLITGTCTLTENTTTTQVTDPRCGPDTKVFFTPTTANAAAEIGAGGMYVSAVADGSFTVTHADNAQTDRDFDYIVVG